MGGRQRVRRVIVGLLIVQGLVGCNASTPSQPTSAQSTPAQAAVPAPSLPAPAFAHRDVTLSGFITDSDNRPVQWLWVYCEVCGALNAGGHTYAWADAQGFYSFRGIWAAPGVPISIWAGMDGYSVVEEIFPYPPWGRGWIDVMVNVDSDTRFDIHVVRR